MYVHVAGLCNRSMLSEAPREPGISVYLGKVWKDSVEAAHAAGSTHVAMVDTYSITKAASIQSVYIYTD